MCEIVEESAANGWEVVVVSFFLDVLDTVHTTLGEEVVGVLNGRLSPVAKQELIDDFAAIEGHAVLVSQVESGGTGRAWSADGRNTSDGRPFRIILCSRGF